MKKLIIAGIAASLLFAACASSGSAPSGPRYKGDGGKDMSLAILVPQAQGLAGDQTYLPAMTQGVFVGDFSKYSAVSVLDRQNLDKMFTETLDGVYEEDNPDIIRLGHLTHTDYIMTGSITKTGYGYALQMQIGGTKDGMIKASYTGNCSIAEFDNFTGVHKASLELLAQMGIDLTDTAKQELSSASSAQQVSAQNALAQGITAQKSGNVVASLAYYYQALNYDPSFKEASGRLNTLSTTIRTGSFGDEFREDLAKKHEWQQLFNEAREYFLKNKPVPYIVVYEPKLKRGKVDYQRETAQFSTTAWIATIPLPKDALAIMKDLNKGLQATGRNKDWCISFITPLIWQSMDDWNWWFGISPAQLLDTNGNIISQTMPYESGAVRFRMRGQDKDYYYGGGFFDEFYTKYTLEYFYEYYVKTEYGRVTVSSKPQKMTLNFTVNAKYITDAMSVRFLTHIPVMTEDEYKALKAKMK